MHYRVIIWGIAAVALSCSAIHRAEGQPFETRSDPFLSMASEINDAFNLVRDGRFSRADDMLSRVLGAAEFPSLHPDTQRAVKRFSIIAAIGLGDYRRAYAQLVALSTSSDATPEILALRVECAQLIGNHYDAVQTLLQLVETWPDQLSVVDVQLIGAVLDATYETDGVPIAIEDLALKLDEASFSSQDLSLTSGYWYEFILLQAEKGRIGAANTAFASVLDVSTLISMLVDRRFDEIVVAYPEAFDLKVAMAQEIALHFDFANSGSHRVASVIALSKSLRRADRLGEALAVLDRAAEAIFPPVGNPQAWVDLESQFAWFLNERANVLWSLGLLNESTVQLTEATTVAESGSSNISQSVNLGIQYLRLGMIDKAEDAVSRLTNLSGYGQMLVNFIQLGIAIHEDRQRTIRRELDNVEGAKAVSIGLYQKALLLNGQLDDAADVLIERLNDPAERRDVLLGLQAFIEDADRFAPPEFDLKMNGREDELLARQDVREALEAVGRIRSFPYRLVR